MKPIRHVLQKDSHGCGPACVAMVVGRSYEEVAAIFPPERMQQQGFTHDALQEALWRFGFASIFLYRVDQLATGKNGGRRPNRDPWPPKGLPYPRIVSLSRRAHFVVEVEDQLVLDPTMKIGGPIRWDVWREASSVIVPVEVRA